MGVTNLWKLLGPAGKRRSIETLASQRLAVDVSIWLEQIAKAMVDSEGRPIPNGHIQVMLNRICKLLYHNIFPVFVFDGARPNIKRRTLAQRQEVKRKARSSHKRAAERILLQQLKIARLRRANGNSTSTDADAAAAAVNIAATDAKKPEEMSYFDTPRARELDMLMQVGSSDSEGLADGEQEQEGSEGTPSGLDDLGMRPQDYDTVTTADIATKSISDQFEIMQRKRERDMYRHRAEFKQANKGHVGEFSSLQLSHFLKRSKFNQEIFTLRDKMMSSTKHLGETARRIASEENKAYIYTRSKEDNTFAATGGGFVLDSKSSASGSTVVEKERKPYEPELKPALNIFGRKRKKPRADLLNLESDSEEERAFASSSVDKWMCSMCASLNTGGDACRDCQSTRKDRQEAAKAKLLEQQRKDPSALVLNVNMDDFSDGDSSDIFGDDMFATEEMEDVPQAALTPAVAPALTSVTAIVSESDEEVDMMTAGGFIVSAPAATPKVTQQAASIPSVAAAVVSTASNEELDMTMAGGFVVSDSVAAPEPQEPDDIDMDTTGEYMVSAVTPAISDIVEDAAEEEEENLDVNLAGGFIVADPVAEASPPAAADPSTSSVAADTPAPAQLESEEVIADASDSDRPDVVMMGPPAAVEAPAEEDAITFKSWSPAEQRQRNERTNEHIREANDEIKALQTQKRKAASAKSGATDEMKKDVIALLELFGIPYVIAEGEAEAQCAQLEMAGLVEGSITNDSDIFLFGSRRIYRNLFNQKKYLEEYHMDVIEKQLRLSREDLICMAMLLGSDYTSGVKGVGIVNAMETINAFPGVEGLNEFRRYVYSSQPYNKKPQPPAADSGDDSDAVAQKQQDFRVLQFKYQHRKIRARWELETEFPSMEVINAYRKPMVDNSEEAFSWAEPNRKGITNYIKTKLFWDDRRIAAQLNDVFKAMKRNAKAQTRLERFFTGSSARVAQVKSARIQNVLHGNSAADGARKKQHKKISQPKRKKRRVIVLEDDAEAEE